MSDLQDVKAMSGEEKTLYRDYKEDLDQHDSAIVDYDAYEAMDMGKTFDTTSRTSGNGLTDNMTATIYMERAARVAGQLPEGETKAFGKKDTGKGLFLDILRTNWIYPNANAQFDFLTKMFLWQYGSSQYNVIPMHYDINVNEHTGYIGPDCWVWNPRNFIPQAGITSVTDMDYAHALAYKTVRFFDDIIEDESEEEDEEDFDKDAIREVIEQIRQKTRESDVKRDSLTYRERVLQSTRQVVVATRYEAGENGRWITFLPDFNCKVIRNIKNPHKNGRIPFVLKRCIPKIDSYYGNGDFQRSMPMQFANDGLDNFYFQGIKMNLWAPKAVNMQTAVEHTIVNEPGALWQFNGSPDFKNVEGSNAGLSTYQAAKGMAKGAIQSIAGTTDTRANAENSMDPGMGKTPQALKMIGEREGTRDNFDRGMLERAMAELIDGFYSIIPTISTKIPVDLFVKEIEEIIEVHPDLEEMFTYYKDNKMAEFRLSESEKQLQIKIDPSVFKDVTAKFELKGNSTAKQTREQQLQGMQEFFGWLNSLPNALDQYQQATGKVPDWQFIFSEYGKLADLPFLSKMFTDAPVPPQSPAMPGAPTGAPAEMAGAAAQPVQPDPAMLDMIRQASPQAPVMIGNHPFTNPNTALEAYQVILQTQGA